MFSDGEFQPLAVGLQSIGYRVQQTVKGKDLLCPKNMKAPRMSIHSALHRFALKFRRLNRNTGEDVYRSILEESADVICHVEDGRFTYISPSAAHVFGWDAEALIGKDPLSTLHKDDVHVVTEMIARLEPDCTDFSTTRVRAVCGDGSTRWCETTSRLTTNGSGGRRGVLVMRDISERKRLEEEMAALALQDGLTGLANRRAFDQTLDLEWKRTLRSSGEMALLLLDVDYFKQFNDTYGHQAGDDCLRAIAACAKEQCRRPGDMVCRYGGEEIAVILAESGADAALARAEAIRASIEALDIPHEQSGCSNSVTVSIGAGAAFSRTGGSVRMPESLLQAADHALYKAKNEGRNCVRSSILIAPSGGTAIEA
jgi:diguanylate cyclase (GGDEF)-like protein/PAS domain S-box-containing protein